MYECAVVQDVLNPPSTLLSLSLLSLLPLPSFPLPSFLFPPSLPFFLLPPSLSFPPSLSSQSIVAGTLYMYTIHTETHLLISPEIHSVMILLSLPSIPTPFLPLPLPYLPSPEHGTHMTHSLTYQSTRNCVLELILSLSLPSLPSVLTPFLPLPSLSLTSPLLRTVSPISPPGTAYWSSFCSANSDTMQERMGLHWILPSEVFDTIPGRTSSSWPTYRTEGVVNIHLRSDQGVWER